MLERCASRGSCCCYATIKNPISNVVPFYWSWGILDMKQHAASCSICCSSWLFPFPIKTDLNNYIDINLKNIISPSPQRMIFFLPYTFTFNKRHLPSFFAALFLLLSALFSLFQSPSAVCQIGIEMWAAYIKCILLLGSTTSSASSDMPPDWERPRPIEYPLFFLLPDRELDCEPLFWPSPENKSLSVGRRAQFASGLFSLSMWTQLSAKSNKL